MDLILLLACILVCEGAGAIGSVATKRSIPNWYQGLKKPRFNPPNRLFAPAWTILYLLMGTALYFVLLIQDSPWKLISIGLFSIQLALNVLWSLIFFGRKSLKGGLIMIMMLLVTISLTLISFLQISELAAILLIPYLIWTGFATLLNYSLIKLNPNK
jgi:tryptophan-rich sensory protein